MKSIQTLDEVQKYLMCLADALDNQSRSFSIDKQDRVILEKYAEGLYEYYKGLEQLKNNMISKEEKKMEEETIEEK